MHLKKISNPDIGEYLRLVDSANAKYDAYQESMTKENSDAFLLRQKLHMRNGFGLRVVHNLPLAWSDDWV